MDDNFVLNRLMFCMAHGNELCNKCYCDHRMCNNIIAESMEGSSGAAKRLIKDAVSVYFFPLYSAIHAHESFRIENLLATSSLSAQSRAAKKMLTATNSTSANYTIPSTVQTASTG